MTVNWERRGDSMAVNREKGRGSSITVDGKRRRQYVSREEEGGSSMTVDRNRRTEEEMTI